MFYHFPKQGALFAYPETALEKDVNFDAISAFFVQRLETVFAQVVKKPLPLRNTKNVPIYLLCFAAGNPIGAPTAVKIAGHILQHVFDTMRKAQHHIFQILTKRSIRLLDIAKNLPWVENIWMGVSVEDARVVSRVRHLQQIPAHVRFLSCEPLIGSLDNLPLEDIHWVIVGGESGPSARPMQQAWVESILHQCRNAGVPFFFKQWGGPQKKRRGRVLHGRMYNEFPIGAHMGTQECGQLSLRLL